MGGDVVVESVHCSCCCGGVTGVVWWGGGGVVTESPAAVRNKREYEGK